MNTERTNPQTANHNGSSAEEQPSVGIAERPTLEAAPVLHGSAPVNEHCPLPVSCSASAAPADIPHSEISTVPSSAPCRTSRRNGRIACLPRVQRDMVNHMLWNAVPYKNIVAAIDEEGYTVTERQISSWATGGYLE